MNRLRTYSLLTTLAVLVLLGVLLHLCRLSLTPPERPERTEIELLPDEYVAMNDMIMPRDAGYDEPAKGDPVQGDEAAPGQASGTDLQDAGDQGPTLPELTTPEPQPVKQQEKPKPDKDAAARKKEQQEKRTSQNINTSVNNAFTAKPESSVGNNPKAPAKENGGNTSSPASGVTPGAKIGNGWSVSHFGAVGAERKPLGTVIIEVEVDAEGKVVSASPAGGTPPAASDAKVVAECLRAARQSTFSRRSSGSVPARTPGTLTWSFK